MTATIATDALQACVSNTLPKNNYRWIAGIAGEQPSRGAKSPSLWNACFKELGWDAFYMAWDVEPARLADFVKAARTTRNLLGFSVTMPHKIRIMEHLDTLDPLAKRIGAVNAVARSSDGKLTGYNTDGQGALDTLIKPLRKTGPLLRSLNGLKVVMIGAGGAARATAFFVSNELGPSGKFIVVNRSPAASEKLAADLRAAFGIGESVDESELPELLKEADLVINASLKGQSGWRSGSGTKVFSLEPYSCLATASPSVIAKNGSESDEALWRRWWSVSRADMSRNHASSAERVTAVPSGTVCFDLIYSPYETVFLTHARWSGHQVVNGKAMNIAQAADAFVNKIGKTALKNKDLKLAYQQVFDVMQKVW